MDVYVVDGTYELFRHFFAVPSATDASGQEIAAVRGVLRSMLSMLEKGVTHIGVATDRVIESFRNDLYAGYKTGAGVPHELLSQFPLLEEGLRALGVRVWDMVEFEADDALAAAAAKAGEDARVGTVFICTPDKDLAQSVVGERIVQMDRIRNVTRGEGGIIEKFGVAPKSIPDYLALVGDSADGYPGLPGWGAKATSSVLSRYAHLEQIPSDPERWDSSIRGRNKLATTLFGAFDDALLFRTLATLRLDVPVFDKVDELEWRGPGPELEKLSERLKSPDLMRRANELAGAR